MSQPRITKFLKCRVTHLRVHRLQKKYCIIFYANKLLITKFTRPTSHTSNTVEKLKKVQVVWTCKPFHNDVAAGMLVVVLLLPLSLSMYDSELGHGGGGGGGGGPAAAAAAVMVAVAAVDDNYPQMRPARRALTVAWRHAMTKSDGGQQRNN